MNLFYILCLGLAVSIDGFVAGIAYGLKNICIPITSISIVCIITILCTTAGMATASLVGAFINTQLALLFGALLLILVGLFSLVRELLSKDVLSNIITGGTLPGQLTFSIGRLVINIMSNPELADVDHSQGINPLEALFLGLALGVDNMIATFAATLMEPLPFYTPLIMGIIQILVISAGSYISVYFISERIKKSFPYLPGTILILLGIIRLF